MKKVFRVSCLFVVCVVLASLVGGSVVAAAPDLEEGLVGHWPFDGEFGVEEVSGLPDLVEGKFGQAAMLWGNPDHFVLGSSPDLQPRAITVSLWLMRIADSMQGTESVIIWAKGDGHWNGPGWFLNCQDGGGANMALCMMVDDYNHFHTIADPHEFYPLEEWVHIVVTFDSGTKEAAMYRNGEPLELEYYGEPSSISASDVPKYFGFNSPAFSGAFLSGVAVDELRIYNRVLTPEEIQALYAAE